MKITYFNRHPEIGFSIQKVFGTLISEIQKSVEVENINMPRKGSLPIDVLYNNLYTYYHSNKNGINHITGHIHDVTIGLISKKTILTIHDLVFIDNVKNPIKRFYKWLFWLYLPIKLSDKVVCISSQTKNNILNHIKTDKLSVIYNPIDPLFKYTPKEFNKEKPVILHIGTGWNKNLLRVIESLSDISCHLRIIGKLSTSQHLALETSKIEYSNVYNISDKQIKDEYVNCDIVSFPSKYEGFGMPIIEGQKTGRVVVASKIEPLIEVSGDAVEYVNAQSTISIRQAFEKVIYDEEYRKELITKGVKNVERFDVQKIAEEYINLYSSI